MLVYEVCPIHLYLVGHSKTKDGRVGLHLQRQTVDFNTFTDEDAARMLADFVAKIKRKSDVVECDASFVSKEEFYSLGGPLLTLLGG